MNSSEPDHRHEGDRNVIAKVRKLLTKAERTDNAEEADAFSRKAAEVIAAHRLDPRRLRAEEATNSLSTRTFNVGRGPYVRARLSLLKAVVDANGCRMVYRSGGGVSDTIAFVAGFESDLDSTDPMYNSLHTQASIRMAGERRESSGETRRFRRSFLLGFAAQVRVMLTECQQAAENTDEARSSLPMLRARDQRVDEYAREAFGRVRTGRRPDISSAAGWLAGRSAAADADLGRRGVSETRSLGPAA